MNRHTGPRSPELKRTSGPSPHSYKEADIKWKKLSQVDGAKSATYTFVKEKS